MKADKARSVMAGLRGRLMVWLLSPMLLIMALSSWLDYSAAGNAAAQQDQNLQRLAPLLIGSVVAPAEQAADPPVVLLAPAIEDFIKERDGLAAWGIGTLDGRVLLGPAWLSTPLPSTNEPEFHSEQEDGRLWRILAQRSATPAGEFVLLLADGSDARQSWLRSLLLKVLLPNLLLMLAVAAVVYWGVGKALEPLHRITQDITSRSSADLTALPSSDTPTEVQPLVQSLNGLLGRMREQHEAQRRFVADAAHQLRTPLAGLQAQVEAWVHRLPSSGGKFIENSAVAREFIAQSAINIEAKDLLQLRAATRRTSLLATQLLALSRADAQALEHQPMQAVDLRQLCADVLGSQLDTATQLGVDLGVELSEGDALQALGHAWLLRELLTNLCDNAIRYTHEAFAVADQSTHGAAQVTLVAQRAQGGLLLQVRDNGAGLIEAERSKVLQRFYRVSGTRSQGNGLGLSIAQEIAQLHHSSLVLSHTYPQAAEGHPGLTVSLLLTAFSATDSM